MAIAFPNVVKAVGSGATSVTTGGVTTTTGSTFLIGCSFGQAFWGTISSFTDSKGNTYTRLGAQLVEGILVELAYCSNGVGGTGHTATVTGPGSADYPTVFFAELSGAAVASYDAGATVKASDSSAPYAITSGALTQADSAVVVLSSSWEGGVVNQGVSTGYAVVKEDDYGNYFGGCFGYKTVNSTAAETATITGVAAGTAMTIAAFKAAGGGVTVSPSGIASVAALGAPGAGLTLAPAGAATSAALGTPTVAPTASVAPVGIASAAALGASALGVGVAPAGIAASAAIGAPVTGASLAPAGVAASSALGTPTVGPAGGIVPTGIPSAAALGAPTLAVTLGAPGGIDSGAAVGQPSAAATLAAAGIASSAAFGTPGVMLVSGIAPQGIASVAALGVPFLRSHLVIGGYIHTADAFGVPAIMATHALAPAGVASAAAFGVPFVYDPNDTGPTEWVFWAVPGESHSYTIPGEDRGYRIGADAHSWKMTP